MGRSTRAKIIEMVAKTAVVPKGKTITDVVLAYRKAKGKKKYNLPLLVKLSEKVDDVIDDDLRLFYLNTESNSNKIVIYLHGGAYVDEFLPFHWLMLDKITREIDCTFIIPDYPLAPHFNYRDCYKILLKFYKKVLKYYPDKQIIFMGDSAGGGLALGLTMFFNEKGLRLPDKHILLSPWIDLNMDNPEIDKYIKVDPTLNRDELLVDALYWANGTDLKDYRLSPIYGDVTCLKDVTLFSGTHEFLYPDIVKFSRILKRKKIKNTLIIGEGLNHVYPAYPIPEADEAIKQISKIINKK